MKNEFLLRMPPRVTFGPGRFAELADEIKRLAPGKAKTLLVVDPALAADLRPRLKKMLAGHDWEQCAIPPGEPTVKNTDTAAGEVRRLKPNLVVGIGGGSTMDSAKALAALATNPGGAEEYRGLDRLKHPPLPTIMVPTTAGTGSEVTPTAVLVGGGRKGGINSPLLIPAAAILDPELTLTMPRPVTVATGLDAMAHAIESFLSRNSNPFTEPLSLQAVRLLAASLPRAAEDGANIDARTACLAGNLLGGITLANAGVIAGHSLSYPLGPRYGISHGEANGILLAHVMENIAASAAGKMNRLATVLAGDAGCADPGKNRPATEIFFNFCRRLGFDKRLRDFGVRQEDFAAMAEEALGVAVPIANTPGRFGHEEAVAVYRSAW